MLVEGVTDRLFFEELIKLYQVLFSEAPEVIEVLEVYGKINLEKYRRFLEAISVPNFIIADFDYLQNVGNEDVKKLFIVDHPKIDKKVIKDKKSIDGKTLSEQLENAINSENLEDLKKLYEYIKSRKRKLKDNLTHDESTLINDFLNQKEADNIFILREGEIENYLPKGDKSLEGLIGLLRDNNYFKYLLDNEYCEQRQELTKIIFSILSELPPKQDKEIVFALENHQVNAPQ